MSTPLVVGNEYNKKGHTFYYLGERDNEHYYWFPKDIDKLDKNTRVVLSHVVDETRVNINKDVYFDTKLLSKALSDLNTTNGLIKTQIMRFNVQINPFKPGITMQKTDLKVIFDINNNHYEFLSIRKQSNFKKCKPTNGKTISTDICNDIINIYQQSVPLLTDEQIKHLEDNGEKVNKKSKVGYCIYKDESEQVLSERDYIQLHFKWR